MATTLAENLARAAEKARRHAREFPDILSKDALPWAVIEDYDAQVRGLVERDPRLEDERDRVLIAAVKFAETPPDETEEFTSARDHLIGTVDGLEQTVLRLGIISRRAAKLGLGEAGRAVGSKNEI